MTNLHSDSFSISRVISRTMEVLGGNLLTFLILAVLLGLLPDMGAAWLTRGASEGVSAFQISSLVGATFGLLGKMAMLCAAMRALAGKSVSFGESLSEGMRLFFAGFGISWLTNAGIILASLLLIVPGIVLATWWCVALPARIAGGEGVVDAIGKSRALTKGHRWAIAGLFAIALAVFLIPLFILGVVGAIISGGGPTPMIDIVLTPLATMIAAMVSAASTAAIYQELVRLKGADTATAEVFA